MGGEKGGNGRRLAQGLGRVGNWRRSLFLLQCRAMSWYFVSDLHGDEERCRKLADALLAAPPAALLVGGDLLPGLSACRPAPDPAGEFLNGFFLPLLARLARSLGARRPEVLLIPGNDDPRCLEPALLEATAGGALRYLQNRKWTIEGHPVFGYGCIPPSPFPTKAWERYDVSHTVDPGCVPPEEGVPPGPSGERESGTATIAEEDRKSTRLNSSH